MSDYCKFNEQIQKSASKGRGKTGWICRVFSIRSREEMLILYKALVLHLVECCCRLWNPTTVSIGCIQGLENVQRSFTRCFAGLSVMNYWDRLKERKLYSLERRRKRCCIIYIRNFLNSLASQFGEGIIKQSYNHRIGPICQIPPLIQGASRRLRTISDNSLAV